MEEITQKILGKTTQAFISQGGQDRNKRPTGLKGLVIEFVTENNIKADQVLQVQVDAVTDKWKTFMVREVEITEGNKLIGRATEYGYWSTKLERNHDLDIRTLVGCQVELVEDAKKLNIIHTEACWC